MTRFQLEQIVAWWIPRLGLQAWNVTVMDDDDWIDGGPHGHAYTWRANDYDDARLFFNPEDYPTWSRVDTHRVAVHELLHLVTREIEFVLSAVEPHLAGAAYDVVQAGHRHAVEGAVDRLAYRFVELAGITESSRP